MFPKKLHYAAGDDLQLYATPEEAMREGRRRAEEEKMRRQQKYELSSKTAKVDTRVHSAPTDMGMNGRSNMPQYQHGGVPTNTGAPIDSNRMNQVPLKNARIPPPPPRNSSGNRIVSTPPNFSQPQMGNNSRVKQGSPVSNGDERDVQVAMRLFQNHDVKNRGRLTAEELQNLLQNDDTTHFCISSIDALINMFGASRFGTVNQKEFVSLYKRVKIWRKIYVDNDINGSFTLTVTEFHNTLQELGYLVPFEVSEKLFDQYAEFINQNHNEKELKFDRFVESLVWLMRLTNMFRKFDGKQEGIATIHYKDFIETVLYLGRFLPH
ncbi:hypothetical protein Kpol_1042p21 [Vanderwaltozyma polyspora DSM 70294]|uniref:EF-hand domain-containing protein n=1 Tax=Vanderwaltozyma polyspora (strain ATCC 22028 / DSM 70294 / BCRC 21397 / CBS 2163 / NBRC 10782 / NRRL Y-8283 / UCD 57-17) TaxID=436907 RepID=A7TQA6_VANPO|nr:uncharacterized protein Kpol_1042p21 [Vanderwaltozyma polyspora DSM 70294]EDO15560.1 hypothetical protein Kpol_1042p21 [Vanderwaltozyma polyspora DSM 70294]